MGFRRGRRAHRRRWGLLEEVDVQVAEGILAGRGGTGGPRNKVVEAMVSPVEASPAAHRLWRCVQRLLNAIAKQSDWCCAPKTGIEAVEWKVTTTAYVSCSLPMQRAFSEMPLQPRTVQAVRIQVRWSLREMQAQHGWPPLPPLS